MNNVIIGQSGGPTAAINASVAGAYVRAKELGARKVFGMLHGIEGLVNGNIIAMTAENTYTFSAEPNTVSERFQVIGRNNAPTAIENNAAIEGANKRIENGKVVIIKNGVKYDVLGTQL